MDKFDLKPYRIKRAPISGRMDHIKRSQLKKIAKKRGLSVSELVGHVMDDFVDKNQIE